MELAASALAAVGTTIASVATAGASAASAVTGTVGSLLSAGSSMGALTIAGVPVGGALSTGGSLLSGILSGGASLASVMGAMNAGREQQDTYNDRAMDAIGEQQIERIRGIERRDGLRRALLERLGEQDVAAAASGVDLSFGTPALARQESERDGERALVQDQATQDLRIGRLQQRADEFTRAGRKARRAGNLRAFGAGVTGVTQALARG
jgi:hypothetical protein